MLVAALLGATLVAVVRGSSPCDASAFDRETCGRSVYGDLGTSQSRIFFGHTARPGEFPWQVALQYNGSHYCGGTILNREFVLTAAHCVQSEIEMPSYFSVVAGLHNASAVDSHVQTSRLSAIRIHPGFKMCSLISDVAIIKLQSPLILNERIAPACFPDKPHSSYIGKEAVISGWGLTKYEDWKTAEVLQFTNVEVMPMTYCEDRAEEQCMMPYLNPDTFCVADPRGNSSVCYGDSGGPMVVEEDGRWVNIGVTSFVYSGCDSGDPYGYKSVPFFADWIRTQMEEM